MGKTSWQEILNQTLQLPLSEQLLILSELSKSIRYTISREGEIDLLSLAGVGQDLWRSVDTEEYIAKERESWGR